MSVSEIPEKFEPSTDDLKGFQERIRALCAERGFSQNQAEEKAGLSRGTLSKIFGERATLSRRHLIGLARALGLTEVELAGGTPFAALLAGPVHTDDVEALDAAHERITKLEQELAGAQAVAQEARRDQEVSGKLLVNVRTELREADEKRSAAESLAARQKVELEGLGRDLAELKAHAAGLEGKVTELEPAAKASEAALAATRKELDVARGISAKLEEDLRKSRSEVGKYRDQGIADDKRVHTLERELRAAREEAADAREDAARYKAVAETAQQQATAWAKHAAEQTSRAEQLERLLKDIQDRARKETERMSAQLLGAQQEAATQVSPGSAFLAGVLALGVGAALGSAAATPTRRRY